MKSGVGADSTNDCEALRCAQSIRLLQGFGRVLQLPDRTAAETSSEEASRLYGMSSPLVAPDRNGEGIDYFISHSWAGGRTDKYLNLLDVYHRKAAVLASLAVWASLTIICNIIVFARNSRMCVEY